MRNYFANFLLTENFEAILIWEKYKSYFSEDYRNNKENRALLHLEYLFSKEGLSCENFGLPKPQIKEYVDRENNEFLITESKKLFEKMFTDLNEDQRKIYHEIFTGTNKLFFIDGPGGTGKTHLYKTIIYKYLSMRRKTLSMAWTGIASILLPKGMTSHRTFRLPLDLTEINTVFLKNDSDKRKLREAELIIWDEASMIPKNALEIVDKTLRDVCNSDEPFGRKLVLLGGDFRQILPVMKYSFRNTIINNTIKNSDLWPLFTILKLQKNMRCNEEEFAKFLLDIGEGKVKNFTIPNEMKTDNVCSNIYKNTNISDWHNRVILAAHNDDINRLNIKVLKYLDGKIHSYHRIDYATHKGVDQTDYNIYLKYPIETLNKVREGLPPHKLDLKINATVMLIRNLNMCISISIST